MTHLPDIYKGVADRYPDVHRALEALGAACYAAGPLDDRTARLIKLGIAIGAQADGAVRSHARRALTEGIGADEIRQVALLALTTGGFPTTVAGLGWIEEVLAAETE
ncbi:MAG TPA: carboxymuconolactone decarboxylase family protein [Baekduia sp.]|nr:carboxymuconolactone decarboxylase family protein [Baekduia sp.]